MKITTEWLQEKGACADGKRWFETQFGDSAEACDVFRKTDTEKEWGYTKWLIRNCFDKNDSVRIAIFSAELVVGIYDKKYPNDDRPRKAIKASKDYLSNPCSATKNTAAYAAADAAADAAYAAAAAAYAAYAAADAAADAAYAAAAAADAAADAAYAAAAAADAADAAYAVDAADADARQLIRSKIVEYCIKLLEER